MTVIDSSCAPVARRSCLSVPANSPAKLAKAQTLGADEVVIDLEDSVADDAKDAAREAALAALSAWDGPVVSVRVNPPRSRWCHVELDALTRAAPRLRSAIIPKVESASDLAFVDTLLDGLESAAGSGQPLRIQALIETPAGVARLDQIAAASSRLEALILGYADLAASLGRPARAASKLDLWLPVQQAVLTAARQHQLQAIDGPFLGTAPDAAFASAARRARDLGFDGKWAIHPSQITHLNQLFTPDIDEITEARAVVAALDRAKREQGSGTVAREGRMLDEATRRSALRVLARVDDEGTPA